MAGSTSETPVLDLLESMTADSLEASSLDPETLALVRIAALAAVDAPPISYLLNLGMASEIGIDAEQVRWRPCCHRTDRRHGANRVRYGQRSSTCSRSLSRSQSSKRKSKRLRSHLASVGGSRGETPDGAGEETPTAAPALISRASAFVVTHVRHALQQTVAIGACSLYLPAAWADTPGPDLLHARIVEPIRRRLEGRSPRSGAGTIRLLEPRDLILGPPGLGHVHAPVSLVRGGHGCEALPKLPRPLCVLL